MDVNLSKEGDVAMGIVLPEVKARAATGGRATRNWFARHPGVLVVFAYAVAAIALNWRLWTGLRTMAPVGDPGPADNDLMAWFVRYTADAVAHGHLPALVTTALNAPHGISLMWNNSILFPGVVLAPVTLLAGPQATLSLVATIGYTGSAAALYWLLRRHGASVGAGALGGAVFGFSPGMVNAGIAHYGIEFAVLVPLMIEAVLSIISRRGRPILWGIGLGLLAAAQVFTGEEMLYYAALVCLIVIAVLALSRPSDVRPRTRETLVSLGCAAVVALAFSGYGLWTQFRGPLAEHGNPEPISKFGISLGEFVNPQDQLLFHTASSAAYADSHGASGAEYVAYLGVPLLIVVAFVVIRYWRDLRIRVAGVVWAVLEALSLGVNGPLLPFHYLQHLPLMSDMIPGRMALIAEGAAAVVLAFGLDLARAPVPKPVGPARGGGWVRRGDWLRAAVPVAVAVLAVLPLVPRPVATLPAPKVPVGWDTVYARMDLPSNASVFTVPLPYAHHGEAMLWQADTGQPAKMVAGWFVGPDSKGAAAAAYWGPRFTVQTVRCLDALWQGSQYGGDCAAAVRASLRYWHPAAVVADTSLGAPLGRFLTSLLGKPDIKDGQMLAWHTSF
jgi:hypothetical protein